MLAEFNFFVRLPTFLLLGTQTLTPETSNYRFPGSPTNLARAVMLILSISQGVDAAARKAGGTIQYQWVRAACGTVLSSILARDKLDGVDAILELLLDHPQGL
jgi:hypothetical protein